LWAAPAPRIVVAVEVVIAFLAPTLGFGLFALLAMRYGAETRPGFDERPVRDDRPNWFAIPGSGPRPKPPAQRPRSEDGHRVRAPRPAAAPHRGAVRPAAVRRPAAEGT
jgi:hypothetical protein